MSFVRRWALLACGMLTGLAAGASACASRSDAGDSAEQGATVIDQVEWLEKAAKVLRNGEGLGPDDDVAALAKLSKSEIVDRWMQDPRFGDSVLAFNLYYLGRSVDQVKRPAGNAEFTYDPIVFEFPQALMAARAAVSDRNYFDLYEGSPSFVFPQAPRPVADSGSVATPPTVPAGERARLVGLMDSAIGGLAENRGRACDQFVQAGLQATNQLRFLGFTPALTMRRLWLSPQEGFPLSLDCSAESKASDGEVAASMRAVRAGIDAAWQRVEERSTAPVRSIVDLTAVPVAVEGLPPIVSPMGPSFFQTLTSSSTNFQRKRAAHMLKTYFCDDLTPLDIPSAEPADAGGDGGSAADLHASSPNCQACHYRLDPMGALFRNIGVKGTDFSGKGSIRFDDSIFFEGKAYEQYLSQWRNPDGGFRAGYWVLGADGKPERERGWTDAHGDTLRGLWPYMRKSKLVKACLVRRLTEYVLGPGQVYDREWLAQVSEGFADGPQSGAQFKRVLKELLLSKTFSIHNPVKGTCYDVPVGAPPNRAPCAIASVVSANCAGCHSSTTGPGRLDFTNWQDVGGGQFSWAHLDENGQQLPRAESQRRMLDRITTADRSRRMPLLRAMPGDDFVTFRGWLTTNLEEPTP
jgi:hypothetical protein